MVAKVKIEVEQTRGTPDSPTNEGYCYWVLKVVNSTTPRVSTFITEDELKGYIDAGVDVTIKPKG